MFSYILQYLILLTFVIIEVFQINFLFRYKYNVSVHYCTKKLVINITFASILCTILSTIYYKNLEGSGTHDYNKVKLFGILNLNKLIPNNNTLLSSSFKVDSQSHKTQEASNKQPLYLYLKTTMLYLEGSSKPPYVILHFTAIIKNSCYF